MGIVKTRAIWTALLASAALATTLAACDGGPATKPAREQAGGGSTSADQPRVAKNDYGQGGYSSQRYGHDSSGGGSDDSYDETDLRKDPVVLLHG